MKFAGLGNITVIGCCFMRVEIIIEVIIIIFYRATELAPDPYISLRKAKAAIKESPPIVHHNTLNPACWASCAPPIGPSV